MERPRAGTNSEYFDLRQLRVCTHLSQNVMSFLITSIIWSFIVFSVFNPVCMEEPFKSRTACRPVSLSYSSRLALCVLRTRRQNIT
jgi:hypothetical protein